MDERLSIDQKNIKNQELKSSLEHFGFENIKGTNYYKGNGFLLETQGDGITGIIPIDQKGKWGTYQTFIEGETELADVRIKFNENSGYNSLSMVSPDGYEVAGGYSGGTDQKFTKVSDLASRLLEQGFQCIGSDNNKNLYEFVGSKGEKFIIKLEDNQLKFVGVSRKGDLLREDLLFRPDTRVTGYSEPLVVESYRPYKTRILQMDNDILAYKVQVDHDLWLKNIKFKNPISENLFPPDKQDIFVQPTHQEKEINIGMPNSTENIRNIESINGKSIKQLEEIMRPDKDSQAGFLGNSESLIEVLASDNDMVLRRGISHSDIARKLFTVIKIVEFTHQESEFQYSGQKFKAIPKFTKGMQLSPFRDGTGSSYDVDLINLDTGKKIFFSRLHPYMIHRYGFYEGHDTSYRLDPEKVMEIFGIADNSSGK